MKNNVRSGDVCFSYPDTHADTHVNSDRYLNMTINAKMANKNNGTTNDKNRKCELLNKIID